MGQVATCYSPVRHLADTPSEKGAVLVRLACVKHAASVHSEPGSNSPYILKSSIRLSLKELRLLLLIYLFSIFHLLSNTLLCLWSGIIYYYTPSCQALFYTFF